MAKPLLKRRLDGKVYIRRPDIEATINAALLLDINVILDRADIRDRKSPAYLPSECIVHLIREFRRRGQDDPVNQLLPKLLGRCGRIVLKKTALGYVPDIEDLKQEVLGRLAELFAEDGGQAQSCVLDFYEVSFDQAFRTLRIEISATERARTKRLDDLPGFDDHGGKISETEALDHEASKSIDFSSMEDPILRLDLSRALAQLPEKERQAIMLHHHFGYEIESEDPTKRTVATICRVTGRTVRNRLRDATTKLETLMEKNK